MKEQASKLHAAFFAKAGQCLLELGEELHSATYAHALYERGVGPERGRDPRGYEDQEPRLASLQVAANPMVRDLGRLACVQSVLKKIEDGTYGFSYASGCPIPPGPIETLPEAIRTLDAEQVFKPDDARRRIQ